MYLSIRDDIVFAAGYASIAEGLHDLEMNSVELFVQRDYTVSPLEPIPDKKRLDLTDPGDFNLLQMQMAEHGIRLCALCMGNNFNAQDKRGEIDWAIGTVRAAAQLGAPVVRIDPIMSAEKDLPIETRQTIVAEALKEILVRTIDTGVELGIENHGYQGNDPVFLRGLLNKVSSERLGLTLDSGNFYWRGWPLSRVYEIFEEFAPIVKHTHVKNIAYPPEIREIEREMGFEYDRYVCPIHQGDIDMNRYVSQLKKVGYLRDLCLEDESIGKYSIPQRKENLREACKALTIAIETF